MEKQNYTSPFDAIRRIDEQGNEYWSARDLYKILGYTEWRNFNSRVIKRAMKACEENGRSISDHFVQSSKVIEHGKGAKQETTDVRLTRYAAYLTVMNGDPNMPIVAMGQEYFAAQTRRHEIITSQIATLPEDQKRLVYRSEMTIFNQQLNEAAKQSGVISPADFAAFTDFGYMGLYKGMGENAIHTHKHLTEKEHILDYMGSEELGANIFRATQTEAKLKRKRVKDKVKANQTHMEVGKEVRETIKRLGGTMPEDLPTPEKSIQQVQHEQEKRLRQKIQPELPFEQTDKE